MEEARLSTPNPVFVSVASPTSLDAHDAAKMLLVIQAADAVACAIPLAVIRRDLDRLGCPPGLQRAIPVVKAASVAGLVAGLREARLGRLTTTALLGYFACAVAAHARVRDPAWRYAAATGMGALVLASRRSYR